MGWGWAPIWVWLGGGGGRRLFEAGRLLTFYAFRMGAIRSWALFRINTVPSYALLIVTICVIITVSQSKDSTVIWKLELHVLSGENLASKFCLIWGLTLIIFRRNGPWLSPSAKQLLKFLFWALTCLPGYEFTPWSLHSRDQRGAASLSQRNRAEITYRKIPKISPSMYKPPELVTQKTLH